MHCALSNHSSLESIKHLISLGADPFAIDKFGNNIFLVACSIENDLDILDFIISLGVDPNAEDNYGNTALIIAADNGSSSIIPYLYMNTNNAYKRNQNNQNALQIALEKTIIDEDVEEMMNQDDDNIVDNPSYDESRTVMDYDFNTANKIVSAITNDILHLSAMT